MIIIALRVMQRISNINLLFDSAWILMLKDFEYVLKLQSISLMSPMNQPLGDVWTGLVLCFHVKRLWKRKCFIFCDHSALNHIQQTFEIWTVIWFHYNEDTWELWRVRSPENGLLFNTLSPRQSGRHFPDDIFTCISGMKIYEFWLRLHGFFPQGSN